MPVDSGHPVLVHFYRAVVSHADVWRQRMDATTNWAAATTAAMVTFAFGNASAPLIGKRTSPPPSAGETTTMPDHPAFFWRLAVGLLIAVAVGVVMWAGG